MTDSRAAVALAAVLAVALVGGAAVVGVVGANHGAEDADYTVEPMSDRSPGAADVKYGQIVVAQAGTDLQTLEEMKAVYEEGSWEGCSPDDSEVWGIDRGNTHDGYEVDEELTENTKTFSAGEDVFRAEFYGEDDFGPSTGLNDGDAVVSVASCIDNPDEPGWYQIEGSTTGVTESGERVTVGSQSHYFWVCDCEDESEAREQLGPPPSEPQDESDGGSESTPTPESTEDDGENTSDDGTQENETTEETESADTSDTESTPEENSGDVTTPEPTETVAQAGAGGSAVSSGSSGDSNTGEASSWEEHKVQTPTPGSGDGFGVPVALGALLAVALLFRRR